MITNMTSTTAKSAAAFVDSIGINADATDAQTAKTIADELRYLGIGHLRTDYAAASNVLIAGSEGAKVDEILPHYMYAVATKDIQNFLAQNIDPAASVVEAVEGPNEVQNDSDSYNGVNGPAGIEAMQRDLYSLTKADTALNNASRATAVFNFSVLQGTQEGTYSGMQSYADFGNVHAYAGSGIPAIWVLPYEVTHNDIAGSDPIVVTETGATTIASSPGVPQDMQARWDIEALLDDANLGISRTYLYNLTDWNTEPGQAGNFSAYYGLYNADNTPKLAATAIHNMTSLLSSSGVGSVGATLSYSLDGMVNNGQTELFAKAGGVFDLALWNDVYYWDATKGSEITLSANIVTLTLAQAYGRIDVYDPLISASPVQSATNASSIAVALGKDPLFIEVSPVVAAPDTSPPTLTVVESASGLINDTSVIISGSVTDAQSGVAGVEVYDTTGVHQVDLGHATIGSNGAWTFSAVGLGDGTHRFTATAIDTAGNQAAQTSAGSPVTVDTVAPQPVIKVITGNSDGGVTLTGMSKANSTVTVVNASASLAGGVGAHFNLVVDGTTVGDATVSSTTIQAYSFNTTLAGGSSAAHDIKVLFDNDAVIDGEDRNLYLQSISVNGQTTAATDQHEIYHATGSASTGFGPGDLLSNGNMYWQGTAEFNLPAAAPVSTPTLTPTPGPDTIVVNASASLAGGVGAHFNLVVDGTTVGDATVSSTTTQAYSFNTTLAGGSSAAHDIKVLFDNDAVINGQDRNLYLQSISVNGQTTAATDQHEIYHATGTASSGFGPGDLAGNGNMYWQGTAEFNLSAVLR